MKLEDERGSMDRKLEELERRDAISKAAVQVVVAPTSVMVRDRVQNVHTTNHQSPITNHRAIHYDSDDELYVYVYRKPSKRPVHNDSGGTLI